MADNLDGMVYRCRNDANWTEEYVSAGARALTGYAPDDLIGSRTVAYADLIHPDDRQKVWDKVQGALRRGAPFALEYRIRDGDGVEKWVWEKGIGVFGEGNEVEAIEGFIQDISGLKAAESRAEHLNDILCAIRNLNQLIIRENDPDALLQKACELLTQALHYECAWIVRQEENGTLEAAGWSGPQEIEEAHRSAWSAKRPLACVHTALRAPGVHCFNIDAEDCMDCPLHGLTKERGTAAVRLQHGDTVYGALVVVAAKQSIGSSEEQSLLQELADDIAFGLHDIELEKGKKRAEGLLRQSQKFHAIGQLAGGVAHDFNNILTGITGFAGFALQAAPPGWEARDDLEEVINLSKRAANLTRQLLAFSRKQTPQMSVVNLNKVVAETTKMLGRLIGEHIALEFNLADGLWKVKADPGQMESALINLAVNARDAMPEGGSLTIETANVELDGGYAAKHAEVVPGPHVLLAVSDTGCGMDEKMLGNVFELFFTTKPVGQGTGMGLATVYGIVRQHGGHVSAYSEPGRGTTFKAYLPRTEEEGAEEAAEELLPPTARSRQTVLVVEDDRAVCSVAARSLQTVGYEALQASDPAEAQKVFEETGGRIALLLADVVMPGMDGPTLFEKLKARQPDLRVLYMSGYTENAIAHHGILAPGMAFLQKPFTPNALRRKVAELLGWRG